MSLDTSPMVPRTPLNPKKLFLMLLRYTVIIVVLYFFFLKAQNIDFSRLWQMPMSTLAYFVALKFLMYFASAVRLVVVLKAHDIRAPLPIVFVMNSVGLLISYILPSSVLSDLSKIYYLKKYSNHNLKIFISLVVDRFAGLLCMVGLLFFASLIMNITNEPRIHHLYFETRWIRNVVYLGLAVAAVVVPLVYFQRARLIPRVAPYVQHLSWPFGIKIVGLSVFAHLLCVFLILQINNFLQIIPLNFLDVSVLFPMATLGTTVPTTPGSIGVGQAIYKYIVDSLTSTSTESGVLIFTVFQLLDVPFLLIAAAGFIGLTMTNRAT